MSYFVGRAARTALFATLVTSVAPVGVFAADIVIPAGVSETNQQEIEDTDTLTVEATGTLDVSGDPAVYVNNTDPGGVVITNSGIITSDDRGIETDNDDELYLTINNNEGGTISAEGDGMKAEAKEGFVTVNNAGLIISTDDGQAIDFNDLEDDDLTVLINNMATGVIRSTAADALRPGQATVNNYGLIESNDGDDSSSDAIDLQDDVATINNFAGGIITGDRHGVTGDVDMIVNNDEGGVIIGRNGSGVGSDGDGTVTNYGTITGAIDGTSTNGDGDGVDIDFSGTIVNYGTIEGIGAKGVDKGGSPNNSEGIAMGGGSVQNIGADALISGADNGILIDDGSGASAFSATTITNSGTIQGLDGYGITFVGVFDDTVTNSGTISGSNGLALDMGDGNDTLNVNTGAVFVGSIDGGAGTDAINLDGEGTFAGGDNFEMLTLVSGAWTLTGTQAYANGTSVNANSELVLSGSLSGGVTVDVGGGLSGTGAIDDLTVSGTIEPGNSIGTINVTNDFEQTAGGTYVVELDSASSDLIAVSGTATLAGTVEIEGVAGAIYTAGTRYTILTAGDPIVTTYDGLNQPDLLFIDFVLAYDTNAAYVDVVQNATDFEDAAGTTNQQAAAGGVQSLGTGNAVFDAVASLSTTGQAQTAFESLSGEAHASTQAGLVEAGSQIAGVVNDRVRDAFGDIPDGTVASHGDNPQDGFGLTFWAQGYGTFGHTDGNANTASVDRTSGGFMIGADTLVGETWLVGLAAGYGQSSFDVDARASQTDADNYTIAAYGGTVLGPIGLRFGGAYTWHQIDSDRTATIGLVSYRPEASYDGHTLQAFAEAGYAVKMDAAVLEPFANLAYVGLHTDGFTESTAAGLTVASEDTDVGFSTLGLRVATDFLLGDMTATLHGTLGWRHAFGDTDPSITANFSGGSAFTVDGAPIAEDAALLQAGLGVAFTPEASLDVSYRGQIAGDAQDHGVNARFAIRF